MTTEMRRTAVMPSERATGTAATETQETGN